MNEEITLILFSLNSHIGLLPPSATFGVASREYIIRYIPSSGLFEGNELLVAFHYYLRAFQIGGMKHDTSLVKYYLLYNMQHYMLKN